MARQKTSQVDRRKFLTGAAVAGAATALPAGAKAQTPAAAGKVKPNAARAPSAVQVAAETAVPPHAGLTHGKPGSDFMVDVIKSLGIDYIAANPGSSFRGLHESIINYGGNSAPELLTCMHEETSAAMCHGYAKIAGKPMAFMAHGTVGLQHASMALYNAWCDRAPVFGILGNIGDATKRRPGTEWLHTAQDTCAIARDFLKWDDEPGSLQHFAESMVRAYKIAMTPPTEPVAIVADAVLQEDAIEHAESLAIPRYTPTAPPAGDMNAVRETARLLAAAESPVIVVDRVARAQEGIDLLVELAETLNCPVVDQRGRMNFPTRHHLCHSDRAGTVVNNADVIVGMELTDFWGTVYDFFDNPEQTVTRTIKKDAKLVSITAGDAYIRSNYQDFQRFTEVDIAMAADAQATLPHLVEAVKQAIPAAHRGKLAERGEALRKQRAQVLERSRTNAALAWDAAPISTSRLCAEIWNQIRTEDWSLVSRESGVSTWPRRLWDMSKPYHYIGGPGGQGVGYTLPAAVGAALANRAHGRLSVCIQPDGDMMYAPGALWTAVHHKIPLLLVMHNNGGYHQEVMHIQRMGNRRQRGVDRAHIGNEIANPGVDYAMLAKSMGMWSEGPVTDPNDLGPALKRAIAIVKSGAPALLDVVTQPR